MSSAHRQQRFTPGIPLVSAHPARGPDRSAPVGNPLLRLSRKRFTDRTAPHVIKAQLPHGAPRVEPTTHVYVFAFSW